MKYRILHTCIFLIFFTNAASSQYLSISPELASELNGKKKFQDIMTVVDHYYTSRNYYNDRKLRSEFKKWNRWAWYAVRHLNAEGEVDYNTDGLFLESEKMKQEPSTDRSRTNSANWNFVGPYTTTWANNLGSKGIGRVDRIVFHPNNSNVILAATPAGGLWRTNDGGFNWYSISSNLPNCGISGIVVSADDPFGNKIFILTGDGDSSAGGLVENFGYGRTSIGVLYTLDGGGHWMRAGNSAAVFNGVRGFRLLQVRGTPSRLIAGTNNGIYMSNNFGNTWFLSQYPGSNIYDLEQHPTNNSILYAAANNTVLKSTDNGQSFSIFPIFSPTAGSATRSVLSVTPAKANNVYYLQCENSNRLYKSLNSGDNYTAINFNDLIGGQYSYNCALAVNPTDTNYIVAGGVAISSSTNSGTSFGNMTVGIVNWVPVPSNYIHSDIHDLAYTPNGYLLYAATDGGVFVSSDDGINWEDRSNGLSSTQYYHMNGYDGTADLLIGGAQDNGSAYTTNGGNMNYCGSGDGFSVAFVSGNSDIFFMVENSEVYRFTRSTNDRDSISPGLLANRSFYPDIITHPTNANIVYVGYANAIWRSVNQGNTFTSISNIGTSGAGSGHTGGFAVSAAFPDRLYAANATLLRRSDDQGNSWTTISGSTGWPGAFGVITDLACSPASANEIWVTMTGNNGLNRVFYSGNAGASWINFTGSLPNIPVYCIAYDESGDAYIGTELGVYFMDFAMNDWVPFYNGLPLVPVTDLFVNESLGRIEASTFGRGIWESDLYSDCGPFLFLSGLTEGQRFYQSNGFIETSQVVPGSFGNVLRLRSPQKITFKNGFRSDNNSYVHAVIGNCGQGIFNMTGAPAGNLMTKSDVLKLKAGRMGGD